MNEMPFPKLSPADLLSLEIWLKRTDRSEAGREPFFWGRETEYGVYRSAVTSLGEGIVGGGTMVFQGAPGAGKSALMEECMEMVRRQSTPEAPWVAVAMDPDALQSPAAVVRAMVNAASAESERLREMASGRSVVRALDDIFDLAGKLFHELSERGSDVLGVSVGGRSPKGRTDDQFGSRVMNAIENPSAELVPNTELVLTVARLNCQGIGSIRLLCDDGDIGIYGIINLTN